MYVMFQNQFPTTILWSSLIILDHPWSSCIFWNHLESWHIFGNFWILLGYIGDLLEIHHQGFISYHQLYSANMYNFDISISYKSSFFWFTNYKSDIFHFASFSRCVSPLCLPVASPRCVSPFFLPVVSPQCVSPFLGRSPRASLSAFPLKKSKRMETEQIDFQDLSGIFHKSIKLKGLTVNTWSLWTL